MQEEREVNRAVLQYADLVRRICFLHLQNKSDTEDIFQTVFLKYFLYSGSFESAEHEKAWLIRVTINSCKDWIKSLMRHQTISMEVLAEEAAALEPQESKLLAVVLSLPRKYKDVIYLFYYEGYTVPEIAGLIGKKENTIYSLLARGRKILSQQLGGEELE